MQKYPVWPWWPTCFHSLSLVSQPHITTLLRKSYKLQAEITKTWATNQGSSLCRFFPSLLPFSLAAPVELSQALLDRRSPCAVWIAQLAHGTFMFFPLEMLKILEALVVAAQAYIIIYTNTSMQEISSRDALSSNHVQLNIAEFRVKKWWQKFPMWISAKEAAHCCFKNFIQAKNLFIYLFIISTIDVPGTVQRFMVLEINTEEKKSENIQDIKIANLSMWKQTHSHIIVYPVSILFIFSSIFSHIDFRFLYEGKKSQKAGPP